jgi:mannose-6-phosphate isomerase-like protein (cupin superfamily)
MTIDELEADWTNRGFSFGVGTIKAHDGVNEATHDDKDELVFMESGEYEFTIGDKTFTQEGNSVVLIPAGTTHSIKNLGAKNSKIYYGYKSK